MVKSNSTSLRGGPALTHISGQHDLAFATVQREPELSLDDNAVVDRHGTMNGRLHARCEVDQTDDTAVGNVYGRLRNSKSTCVSKNSILD